MKNILYEDNLYAENGAAAYITVMDWIKLDCINFLSIIPIVGTIAALIIYIILAYRKETPDSIKTRLKANFIWLLISLIISVILCLVFLYLIMAAV